MTFTYEIRRGAGGELLVSGLTKHVSVDAEGRLLRIPDTMRAKITAGIESVTT